MNGQQPIGAFFDLDGTLLKLPSLELRFFQYLLRRRAIPISNLLRWPVNFLKEIGSGLSRPAKENKTYLTGIRAGVVARWAESLRLDALPFFREGMRRLEWHDARGHQIFLVSGTLAPLARVAAERLPVRARVIATELETFPAEPGGHRFLLDSDCWTGRIAGEHISGKSKARMLEHIAAEFGIDLSRSFGYGDRPADIPMLECVGQPAAVNPSARLERYARQRGWPILEWHATADEAGARFGGLCAASVVRGTR